MNGVRNGESAELLLAAAYLSRVAEPASLALWAFVRVEGYEAAAAAVRRGSVPAEVAACTEARRQHADPHADLEAAARNGIRLITPASPDWPHFGLAALEAAGRARWAQWRAGRRARPDGGELIPPLALWVAGAAELTTVGVRSVAVVGSRAATAYGEHVTADLASGLAHHGVVVVSGGAYGIDAAAHRGALAADGVSVLVSAGGLDRPYPAGHAALFARTVERGLLVSERPPGSAPHRQRFLSRNRLIAAFGTATLVVEAARRSGALNTARYARDLGRPVLAVPGPVTSAMSTGCHALIQREEDPARLVTGLADVLAVCGPVGGTEQMGGGEPVTAGKGLRAAADPTLPLDDRQLLRDALDADARAVLDGFPGRGFATEAELARLSGQPLPVVFSALPVLLEHGLIEVAREGYRLDRSGVAR